MFNGKRTLKAIMAEKGIKAGHVATELDMRPQTFSMWLYREDGMTVDKLSEVAGILGCHVAIIDNETGKVYD